jgi:hypothetical protein
MKLSDESGNLQCSINYEIDQANGILTHPMQKEIISYMLEVIKETFLKSNKEFIYYLKVKSGITKVPIHTGTQLPFTNLPTYQQKQS